MFKKIALCSVVTLMLCVWGLYLYTTQQVNTQIPLKEPEFLTIKKGTTFNSFSKELVKKQWIDTNFWLKVYVKLSPELSALKEGSYLIPEEITYVELLALLVEGKEHQFSVTFIEGSTLKEWLALLKNTPNIIDDLEGVSLVELSEKLSLPQVNPEGLFFPDTYFFTAGTSAFQILKRASLRMNNELAFLWNNRDDDLPYKNSYEALIMASIIEKESAIKSEHPIISSVFINRLNKKMRLQTDPTVIYGLGERYKGDIKRSHLREKTAYNTYRIDGLPPTPIAMPGKLAIKAAMHPDTTDYFYFVSDGFGKHVFTKTLKEHNKAVKAYLLATKG